MLTLDAPHHLQELGDLVKEPLEGISECLPRLEKRGSEASATSTVERKELRLTFDHLPFTSSRRIPRVSLSARVAAVEREVGWGCLLTV